MKYVELNIRTIWVNKWLSYLKAYMLYLPALLGMGRKLWESELDVKVDSRTIELFGTSYILLWTKTILS